MTKYKEAWPIPIELNSENESVDSNAIITIEKVETLLAKNFVSILLKIKFFQLPNQEEWLVLLSEAPKLGQRESKWNSIGIL